ncbi:polysaccharide deacetylase [Butyrivibrio sp. CB08]|uniref:polysaccharide deacetylase family protein n=1 Tax=Butyrivibrio sp. CB08 TaxID=2364879 RepID=UPI000EA9FCC4|nr:polysaccharide deacetylase family protein [Butyrivibrio sp. CB08]RKM62059.1 polysaccharide deacetylase [Butyrivibrio sp. CB08]
MGSGNREKVQYSKRIRYLRRLILTSVAAACLIPICICVILAVRYDRLNSKYEQARADLDWYRGRYGSEKDILTSEENMQEADSSFATDGATVVFETMDVDYATVEVSGAQNPEDIEGTRYVYLTFDDGPSIYTDEILDILAEYDVKATFFVCGKPDAKYTDMYKRIVDEGHTLGMHSYSHKYSDIYSSVDAFTEDLKKLRHFLYDTTDTLPKFYRFPGGSSNKVTKVDIHDLMDVLKDEGVTFYDWNVSAGDDRAGATKVSIYNNIVGNVPKFKHCIVLMHDAADKKSTVEALPEVIEALQAMDDTVIVPITDDTLSVQHINNN